MDRVPADGGVPGPVPSALFRAVCGLFVTGVTVVTTTARSQAVGITVNSFASVSLDPPLVLFCVHRDSRLRPALEEAGSFVVNILTAEQEPVGRAFADRTADRFQDVPARAAPTGAPILTDALAYVHCRVEREIPAGDHVVILGEVLDLGVLRGGDPLTFYAGALGGPPGPA